MPLGIGRPGRDRPAGSRTATAPALLIRSSWRSCASSGLMPPKPCGPSALQERGDSIFCPILVRHPSSPTSLLRDGSNGAKLPVRASLAVPQAAVDGSWPKRNVGKGECIPNAYDRPRQRQPAARPEARRAFHAGPHRSRRSALRLRAGRPHARRRGRIGRGCVPRPLPHPPAQRPHHGPQRHRHVALDHVVQPLPLSVYGPVGTAPLVQATEAMLKLDIGYRLAHHDDLQWRPSSHVVECGRGTVLEEGTVRVTTTPHGPRPRPSHRGLPDRGGRRVGGNHGRHDPVPRARRTVRRGGHARAHGGTP